MGQNQTPLKGIEARYNDLLQHLGVTGHDGAVAEINSLRFHSQLNEFQPLPLETNNVAEVKQFLNKPVQEEFFTRIALDKNNRMLRIGFGKNKGRWFIRIDLWFVGYRWVF